MAKINKQENKAGVAFNWITFALKLLALFTIIVLIVSYTDRKGYFMSDQSNNHTKRKWEAFYKFTKTKKIDVLVVGNSHVFTGIDPFVLSVATGSNCFLLGNSGTGIADAYFSLGEALQKIKPKVVVVETWIIGESSKSEGMAEIQSFEAHRDKLYKLRMMPELFNSDNWVKIWSPTIRNHSFLLTNTAQIEYNIKNPAPPRQNKLELGRFARFETGLEDSTLMKYKTLGAPIDGQEYNISAHSKKYVNKIIELCKSKNVPVLFVTVPMYHAHIAHYETWKARLNEELQKYPSAQWLNLQSPYDIVRYTPDAFENTYDANQHLSNTGMVITGYKLAEYLSNNYSLPDRSKDPQWIADFETQPHFIFNQDATPNMSDYTSIVKNKNMGAEKVKDLLVQKNKNYNRIIIKIEKPTTLGESITAVFQVQYQNQQFPAAIRMSSFKEVFPPHCNVYVADVKTDMQILDVAGIQ
jgi:hypothetical protein